MATTWHRPADNENERRVEEIRRLFARYRRENTARPGRTGRTRRAPVRRSATAPNAQRR